MKSEVQTQNISFTQNILFDINQKNEFEHELIFHCEDEDEGVSSKRMSIEFGGKLIVQHKTEMGEDKRIGKIPEEIPEEEAICEICSVLLKEDISALMMACGCDSFLVHENCKFETPESKASENCEYCDKVLKDTAVTLSRSRSINIGKKSSTKRYWSRISNMFKWSKRA